MRRGKGFFTERDNMTGEWGEQSGFYWTGNFWVGELWRLYGKTKDEKYARWARLWNDAMLGQEPNEHHDVGFLNFYTSAFAYDLTKEDKYKAGALRAAERLKQLYNPRTNLVAAWEIGGEDSIIDTMMNLQIWYWASKETNDSGWRELGRQHALKSAEWLVRPDGSITQSVHYDPKTGRYRFAHTHQGFGNDTAWGRGTGWALYGFSISARETKDAKLLETAEKIARFVMTRTPDDFVSWHDYHDEGVYFRLKDTSAAALAANGFFQLSELVTDKNRAAEYRATGEKIIGALIDRYLTPVGVNDKTPAGVLRHGSVLRPNDTGLTYGDYYLLDALLWLDSRGIERRL
jgi:unsaturated chondroitin disaccharide hydrolase